MGAFRSFYLRTRLNDFSEIDGEQLESASIPFGVPANDNTPTGALAARCRALFLNLFSARKTTAGVFVSSQA